ncbi:MAG: thioesterase family protein [bacterium]
MSGKILTACADIRVRFSEVDMMGVVWHGHYVKFFEDGREAFAREYQFSYLDAMNQGYSTPVVKMNINYKKSLRYNEPATIETTFIDSEAAKIQYDYRIVAQKTGELITTGSTMQVFVDRRGDLVLSSPASFIQWKKKWGVQG